jgi:hypothetical protein
VFLRTVIIDKTAKNFANYTKGIPLLPLLYRRAYSILSPVLMNIFLHQLDMKINSFMQIEEGVGYVRYADDMIFAIKRGGNSEAVYYRVKQLLKKTLENLKQAETSIELIRGRPRKILV